MSTHSSQQSSPNIAPRFVPSHLLSKLPESLRRVPVVVADSSDEESDFGEGRPEFNSSAYYVLPSKPDKRRLLKAQTSLRSSQVITGSLSKTNAIF